MIYIAPTCVYLRAAIELVYLIPLFLSDAYSSMVSIFVFWFSVDSHLLLCMVVPLMFFSTLLGH